MINTGEIIFFLIGLSFFITALAITLSVSHSFRKKILTNWKTLAQNIGLTVISEGLLNSARVEGNYRNHKVQLTTFRRRADFLFFIAVNNQKYVHFALEQRGFVSNVIKSNDAQVKLDDKKFDQLFFLEGFPKDLVRNIFVSESIQKRLMKATWRGYVKIKLDNQQLRFEQPYPVPYSDLGEYLHHILDLLIDIVEVVENETSTKEKGLLDSPIS
jgi:hypothetical protein